MNGYILLVILFDVDVDVVGSGSGSVDGVERVKGRAVGVV